MGNEIDVVVGSNKAVSSVSALGPQKKRVESDINFSDVARFKDLIKGKAVKRNSLDKGEGLLINDSSFSSSSSHPRSVNAKSSVLALEVFPRKVDDDCSDPGALGGQEGILKYEPDLSLVFKEIQKRELAIHPKLKDMPTEVDDKIIASIEQLPVQPETTSKVSSLQTSSPVVSIASSGETYSVSQGIMTERPVFLEIREAPMRPEREGTNIPLDGVLKASSNSVLKETMPVRSDPKTQEDLSSTVAQAATFPSGFEKKVVPSALNHEPKWKTKLTTENVVVNGEASSLTSREVSSTVAQTATLPSGLEKKVVPSVLNHEPKWKTKPTAESVVVDKGALENTKGVIKLHERQDRGSAIQLSLGQEIIGPLMTSSVGEQILTNIEHISEPVPASQIQARQTIVEIGNVIAQRILVHEATKVESEIFVQLRESILPGTGVSFLKNGVSLRVDFLSKMGDSVAFLSQHHVALQEYLAQRLESIKEVKVNIYDHSEKDLNHSSGRGRDQRREKEGSFS
jgi:hypothetical protein